MTSKRSKLPSEHEPVKDGRSQMLFRAGREDAKVIDMAAQLVGSSRNKWILDRLVPAAERDLRAAGINPDDIRKAA